MADYESIWSGKGSLPWESGQGWEQKYRPNISSARREQLLTQQDMQQAKHVLPADTGIGIGSIVNKRDKFQCACGRVVLDRRTVCDRCLSAKRRLRRKRAA